MAEWSEESIRRIIKSVLFTERLTIANLVKDEMGNVLQMPAFGIVRGKTLAAVTADDATFQIDEVHPIGQSAPNPGEPLTVVNVPRLALAARATAYAGYKYAVLVTGATDEGTGTGDGNWEALALSSTGGTSAYAMIVSNVPAMDEISGTAFTAVPGHAYEAGIVLERVTNTYSLRPVELVPAGTGTGTGTGDDTPAVYDKVTVLNFTKTMIRASVEHPIILLGTIEAISGGVPLGVDTVPGTGFFAFESGTGSGTGTGTEVSEERVFIVVSDKDIRSYPNFTKDRPQIVFHEEDSDSGRLDSEECGTGTGTGTGT